MSTKAKNLLTGSCAIALNLLSINTESSKSYQKQKHQSKTSINQNIIKQNINQKHQSKTSEISSKRDNNLTTHDINDKNSCSNLNLADFKTQQEDNIPKRLKKLVQTYRQSLFTRKIGKLKDTKIKLRINESIPSIPPVAQAERCIPFSLRESVRAEIKNLEEQDIIEDVTSEATPWLSQLVIVPKPSYKIRLCIDMPNSNTAIKRTRFPTPTVNDLIFRLKSAQYCTKLDLNAAFHQLELDERSRYITAFQTEDRIKRFKRLIFGLNSASKQLQHHLETLIADISCVVNIAEDILVFASTITEHDLILQKVFQRLSEKGLTLNLDKFQKKLWNILVLFFRKMV